MNGGYYRYITPIEGVSPPSGAGDGNISIRNIIGYSDPEESNDVYSSFYCLNPQKVFPPNGTSYTSLGNLKPDGEEGCITDEELRLLLEKQDISKENLNRLINSFYIKENASRTYDVTDSKYGDAYYEKKQKELLVNSLVDVDNPLNKIYDYLTDDDIRVAQQWALWRITSDATMPASFTVSRDNDNNNDNGTDLTPDHGGSYQSDRNAFLKNLADKLVESYNNPNNPLILPPNVVTIDDSEITHVAFSDMVDYGPFKINVDDDHDYTSIKSIVLKLKDKDGNDITDTTTTTYQIYAEPKSKMGETLIDPPLSGTLADNIHNPAMYSLNGFFLRFNNNDVAGVELSVTYVEDTTLEGEVFEPDNSNYQSVLKISRTSSDNIVSANYQRNDLKIDLALRKYITHINNISVDSRVPQISQLSINQAIIKNIQTTAHYAHKKNPLIVKHGDIITYNMNVYNESINDAYLIAIRDILPRGL